MGAGDDRAGNPVQQITAVGTVAVEKDNDLTCSGIRTSLAGATVAATDVQDRGTCGLGDGRGAVGAAAISNNYLPHNVARNFADHAADSLGFVEGGDDNADAGRHGLVPHRPLLCGCPRQEFTTENTADLEEARRKNSRSPPVPLRNGGRARTLKPLGSEVLRCPSGP